MPALALLFALFAILPVLAGCATTGKQKQLQDVARDWSLTIRASQVIPVYPLTEDLRPGDVFLVEAPLQQQARLYRTKGYLPLDQHLARLSVATPSPSPSTGDDEDEWPRVAFPAYTFKVESGLGVHLALPLHGVPIGLHLLQTDAATGIITIADANSRGLPYAGLRDQVAAWAADRENRRLLAGIRAQAGHTVYLRVVNRVFATRRLMIALSNNRAFGTDANAGQAVEVSLLAAGDRDEARRYTETLAQLNEPLEQALTGGAVRIVQASSRTVTLAETFERPLVFGYLAFDFPVFEDGSLGAPAATRALLEGARAPEPVQLGELSPLQEDYRILRQAIDSLPPEAQATIYGRVKIAIGGDFAATYDSVLANGHPAGQAFGRAWTAYTFAREDESRRRQERVYDVLRAAWREAK